MQNQTRREFIKNAGKLILAPALINSISGCRDSSNEDLEGKLTEANIFLRNFPDKINGVANVQKYEVPGAKQCLAHILQLHYGELDLDHIDCPDLKERYFNKLDEIYKEINNVQREIIVTTNAFFPKELFSEGFTQSHSREDLHNVYNQRLNFLANTPYFMEDAKNGNYDSFKYIPGAELILGSYKTDILPVDSSELLEKLHSMEDEDPRYRLLNEKREDYVLKKVHESGRVIAPVLFGGGHCFYNNIEKWNKNNPDNKFSLIEITPNSYNFDRGLK